MAPFGGHWREGRPSGRHWSVGKDLLGMTRRNAQRRFEWGKNLFDCEKKNAKIDHEFVKKIEKSHPEISQDSPKMIEHYCCEIANVFQFLVWEEKFVTYRSWTIHKISYILGEKFFLFLFPPKYRFCLLIFSFFFPFFLFSFVFHLERFFCLLLLRNRKKFGFTNCICVCVCVFCYAFCATTFIAFYSVLL